VRKPSRRSHAPSPTPTLALALARRTLSRHSKSFALAGKLLPLDCRDDAAVIYTWCRRCDDAIDLGPVASRPAALQRMRRELDHVYAGRPQSEPTLAAFQEVVQRRAIPERYPRELLEGMGMDVGATRYRTVDELLVYCFRVAGTVGLMMCQVMGVSDRRALRRAADLGIAMQLTNICRDVAEDWASGRLYLPDELTGMGAGAGGGEALPPAVAARAVKALLARADDFYRSGDAGLPALRFRCAVAVRTARLIYSEIGQVIARRDHDVTAGRAFVSWRHKIRLAVRGLLAEIAARLRGPTRSPS
jgi:15-cis-phytoene synthase